MQEQIPTLFQNRNPNLPAEPASPSAKQTMPEESPENTQFKEEKDEEHEEPEELDDPDDPNVSPQKADSDEEYHSDAPLYDKRDEDPHVIAQNVFIKNAEVSTELEKALSETLERKEAYITKLQNEIMKLKAFISKRKQTYKRKRKDEGAPTRALSAYNIFVRERFAQLAKENEQALKSEDTDAKMKRVPPSNLVASTGNEWKELSAEEKSKYEERAKADRKRYEEQMAQYQPPDKQLNKKRNKTGYNMFFSAHVLRLKQTESGVPSERGSVARLVGNAWKQLSADEKQYYEREADKHNGMHPVKMGQEEDEDEDDKRDQMEHYHMMPPHPDMHMHPMPPMHPQHDPRHHHAYYPPHMYAQPPYGHYDYSQHHQRQARYSQGYSSQRYDQNGMPL